MRSACLLCCAAVAACATAPAAPPPTEPPPTAPPAAAARSVNEPAPRTRREDVRDVLHGVAVADPYRWLEDEKSPEVQAWMRAQDAFAREKLAALPGRAALASRLRELSYQETRSAPLHRGKRWFYSRRPADKEKAFLAVREGRDAEERVLLDPNEWSKDGSIALGSWSPSWDGSKVAYQKRANNSDEATLHVLDVATGAESAADVIEGAKYARPSWTLRGDGFFYTWVPTDPAIPQTDRTGHAQVRFHLLGRDPREDRVVRAETGDPRTLQRAEVSRDGRFLLLTVAHGWTSTDLYVQDLRRPGGFIPLAVGRDALYEPVAWKGRLYVRTNDGAGRWRVLRIDPRKPAREAWKHIVPERKDATLQDARIVGGKLALLYLADVISHLELRGLDGGSGREVKLPQPGSLSAPEGLEDDPEAFVAFQSFLTPRSILSLDTRSGESRPWFEQRMPIDPSPFVEEQIFFASKDGTRVPLFLVHRKDMPRDGSTKTLLTGYGGFQIANVPAFNPAIYAWLEGGGAWAVANLRGGDEYGEEWHRHGMLLEKQHVFDDFIAAAEKLIADGVTTPGRLAIRGGSNGGLLVAAAATQRPDLFRVVLCAVPLLDMVRFPLFGQAKLWTPEYGSPDDEAQFKALYAYSPYHHLAAGARYPATLVLSADADDRVDPMHARKFVAALQAATSGEPALLRIERHSGHGGADLIRAQVEKTADELAFAIAHLDGAGR